MTDDPTGSLAAFTTEVAWSDIPDHVQRRATDLFIDAVACALLGQTMDEIPELEPALLGFGGPGHSTVLGGGSSSQLAACFVNGYLVTAATICDAHLPTQSHLTPEVLPPTLAMAEERHASGVETLAAFAVGLEVAARTGLALKPPVLRQRGWHSPGVIGPFGGAAAAGRLAGLTHEEQTFAFGLAGSQAAGTFAQWGTVSVKFHQARGAQSGLLAARLANRGFTTCTDIYTNPAGGLLSVYSDGGAPDAITQDLGSVWQLEQISIRQWPVGAFMGSLVAAGMQLVDQDGFDAGSIEGVTVTLSDRIHKLHAGLPWSDSFSSRLSAPYIAAVVLLDRTCTLEQFDSHRVAKSDVNELAGQRMTVLADPTAPDGRVAIRVQLGDGRILESVSDSAPGHPDTPLTRAELEHKVRTSVNSRPLAAPAELAIESLLNIGDAADVSSVLAGLRGRVKGEGQQ